MKDAILVGDGVVLIDGSFRFDRENEIKIDMFGEGEESRAFLSRRFGEAFIEFCDVMIFEKPVGVFFGFDAMKPELVDNTPLKSLIHSLAASASLRGISRDHSDAEFI